MSHEPGTLGLVMGGGGARAAYQVGILSCIARHWPELKIPILTGVSAGAINAAFLANHQAEFERTCEELAELWSNLTIDKVIATGPLSFGGILLRWGMRLVSGGSKFAPPVHGMVDTAPLRKVLVDALGTRSGLLEGVAENLRRGRLQALGITTTDYSTGRSITFVEGRDPPMWRRPHRRSLETRMSVDHVMASSALPLFFPAVRVGDAYHGDGGVRLTAPLSPALHLGAERILAISTRYRPTQSEAEQPATHGYPPPAQVLGVLMNAVFLDMLDYDAMGMDRINRLLEKLPEHDRMGLRPARLLVMRPSRDLARLATQYEPKLPQPLKFLTRGLGTRETKSPDSLSMIMFQPEFLQHILELGVQDAERRLDEIGAFIEGEDLPALQQTGFWRI